MTIAYVTLSNLIVDDIVLPTGETHMNTLGGAGTHAIGGMLVWTRAIGFVAGVGDDFAPEHRAWFDAHGVDLSGVLVRRGQRTPRAWQIFEPDDRRIEIFRTDLQAFRNELRPRLDEIPTHYFQAKGFHVSWGSLDELSEFMRRAKRSNPKTAVLWEPQPTHLQADFSAFQCVLKQCDIFSPNFEEGSRLCQKTDASVIVDTLLHWGAPMVVLRMGKEGSLIRRAGDERAWHVPALPTRVMDVTGAGNAYCGGFLVGCVETGDLLEAGLRGAVSASFAIEQFGPAQLESPCSAEARRRKQVLWKASE